MAQKSRRTAEERPRRNGASNDKQRPADPRQPLLKPETRHGILIVALLTLGPIFLLSVFGWAGVLGNAISNGLGVLLGWQRYVVWMYLSAVGVLLLFPEKIKITISQWIGGVITLFASEGILHMFLPYTDSVTDAINGEGGGTLGIIIGHPLRSAFGPLATAIIVFGLLLVGLMMMFNTNLKTLIGQRNMPSQLLAQWRTRQWSKRLADNGQPVATEDEPDMEADQVEETEIQEPDEEEQAAEDLETVAEAPRAPKPVKRPRRNITIPIDLLDSTNSKPTSGNIEANKEKIRKTFENFGIMVEMGDVNVGPTVTQFTLKPAEGVKLAQISSLNNDLALALAAHPIRIEAPIPGKSLVGIEVPNQSVAIVQLREILESPAFKQRKSDLSFSLGKDVSGQPWVSDIGPLPHLLVAGSTGSGKSVMINGLIVSLLYANSPDDLKLILVDPKRVELSLYNNIPHLLTPVITDTTKTINALRWVVSEMDRRYGVLQNSGKRNIGSYRQDVSDDMPYIVIIIDELADLMSVAANEVEGAIVRLAQMARAVGIHLILATQRPSVDVITGLIKANVTARIAFNVASQIDSRTILDTSGAEKLLGRGDMLFVSAELSKPKRLQGAYISEKEVERVAGFLKQQGQPDYMEEIVEKAASPIGQNLDDLGNDELLSEARDVILQSDRASATLLQRRLRVGYARAARILDLLEEEGFIGPGEGAKPREVYGRTQGAASLTNTIPTPTAKPDIPVDEPGDLPDESPDDLDETDDRR